MTRSRVRLVFVAAAIAWPALLVGAAAKGWVWYPLAPARDHERFTASVVEHLRGESPPNAAFALIQDGMVVDDFYMSKDEPIGRETLFQVMSISKWVTAWVVLTLVESGDLQLDAPITDHLGDWQFPESQYDVTGITVRRLLSHTAGVNNGDFNGFLPDQEMQSLVEFMTRPADGGAHGNVRLDQFEPGTSMRYSNNGYALLQYIVEQATAESFEEYAWRAVLEPLEMTSSTFDTETAKTRSLTRFYDTNGDVSAHRRYGAVAPSSLYTSAADLARFLLAHAPGDAGELPGRAVLSPRTVEQMQIEQTPKGSDSWGLGVDIHGEGDEFTIGHNGSHFSEPSIGTAARINPRTRDGVIVFVSGRRVTAERIAMEWDYWATGRIQKFLIALKSWPTVLVGWLVLALLFLAARRWGREVTLRPAASNL